MRKSNLTIRIEPNLKKEASDLFSISLQSCG